MRCKKILVVPNYTFEPEKPSIVDSSTTVTAGLDLDIMMLINWVSAKLH